MTIQPYGDNFASVITTDPLVHTDQCPNCSDLDCPCYDAMKEQLHQQYQDGLITASDATRILEGRQL